MLLNGMFPSFPRKILYLDLRRLRESDHRVLALIEN